MNNLSVIGNLISVRKFATELGRIVFYVRRRTVNIRPSPYDWASVVFRVEPGRAGAGRGAPRPRESEKAATLAQKLGRPQPFILLYSTEVGYTSAG